MIVGVLKESPPETRVSLLPEAVSQLAKKNIQVLVESNAGAMASASDEDYLNAGAAIASQDDIIGKAQVILAINLPQRIKDFNRGKVLIGVYQPLYQPQEVQVWGDTGLTIFSLDMLPRTTRAQSMDVLSSQANIAGYRAVLLASTLYPRYLPMFMTAAGSIAPAKVLILGAGVAGLQAIATAKRLGAVVEVFDTRPAVKEEVMSLGAKFIEVEGAADASKAGGYAVEQTADFQHKQQARIGESLTKADIVITTAQIPGKKAPVLITTDMVNKMRRGSVIIDLAAATGGNTPFTENNKTVSVNGVQIVGNSLLPSTMPSDASKLYGKNMQNFLALISTKEGELQLNWSDDLVAGSCIVHEGEIKNERLRPTNNS